MDVFLLQPSDLSPLMMYSFRANIEMPPPALPPPPPSDPSSSNPPPKIIIFKKSSKHYQPADIISLSF